MAKGHDAIDHPTGALLLIEGDAATAKKVLNALAGPGRPRVDWVTCLSDALRRIKRPEIVAILLDLFLPDSRGIETFDTVLAAAGDIPILVLCAIEDEPLGVVAVEHGADDFLLKDHLDTYSLTRAVRSMLDRHAKDAALYIEKERAEVTLNSIGDAVLCTDIAGHVTYLNTVAERMTGWKRAEAIGRPLLEVFNIIDGITRERAKNPMAAAVHENRTVTVGANCILLRRDGSECPIEDSAAPIHDRQGQITGAVIVFHDVGATLQMSTQLSHWAQHDFLTDLPNRMLLHDRIQQAISLARRHEHRIAILFMDLDRFKQINDSLGHTTGDQLLQAVANRLKNCIRRSDTVGRQGGDEFVVVLSELDAADDAGSSAKKLLEALALPYEIGSRTLRVPVSIGISIFPDDGDDAETLIDNADRAMYSAKEHGRHNLQYFKREMSVGVGVNAG